MALRKGEIAVLTAERTVEDDPSYVCRVICWV